MDTETMPTFDFDTVKPSLGVRPVDLIILVNTSKNKYLHVRRGLERCL